jgi:hypothetical protein
MSLVTQETVITFKDAFGYCHDNADDAMRASVNKLISDEHGQSIDINDVLYVFGQEPDAKAWLLAKLGGSAPAASPAAAEQPAPVEETESLDIFKVMINYIPNLLISERFTVQWAIAKMKVDGYRLVHDKEG